MAESALPKASILSAIERMSVPKLTAVIEAAERARREKMEMAKQELVAEFRARAAELGFPVEALFPGATEQPRSRKVHEDAGEKRPAKFRGPNGEEWSGRGRLPNWLAAFEAEGRKRAELALVGFRGVGSGSCDQGGDEGAE